MRTKFSPLANWCLSWSTASFLALLLPWGQAQSAIVGPTGYTNAFGAVPSASDWATFNGAGAPADSYNMDAEVNANITAAGVTGTVVTDAGDPPPKTGSAAWSSTGLYLQLRPTGNRYTALMGKFVNNTGTNATQVRISYRYTIAAGGTPEDFGYGTRAYFSLTGQANSWTNLPTLNSTISVDSTALLAANISVGWTNGGTLYFLLVDDNSNSGGDDVANQIDNFALQVTAGLPTYFSCAVTAPQDRSVFVSGTSLTASGLVGSGTPPYTLEYFTNSGVGNTVFASAGSSGAAGYPLNLGILPAGTYNVYAVATDSGGNPAVISGTNTFSIANPIALTITSPLDGSVFQYTNNVLGSVTVSGGTSPYAVQFFFNGAASGPLRTSAPYEYNFGALPVGDHTISAIVIDAKGWVSNSIPVRVHIDGPLAAILTPANGSIFKDDALISLNASAAGGTPPYSATFYTNDSPAGTVSSSPFRLNFGKLPTGSYTCYVHAADSSIPRQEAWSSTNVITVLPPPLRIMPLGDSITYGIPIAGGYRAPLYQVLTNAGYKVDFIGTQTANSAPSLPDPDHEGYSGYRIRDVDFILPNIFAGASAPPDIILVLLGANDYRGSGDDTDHGTNRLEALVVRLSTNWPSARIVVGNLLPREAAWDPIIQTVFNPILPALCERLRADGRQVYFDDIRSVVALADEPDMLHPNQFGYNKMATNWFNIIKLLACTNCPPTFTLHPTNQGVFPGTNLALAASAFGTAGPITYQWRFEGTNIPNATNAVYNVASVSITNLGTYSVAATDLNGTTYSSNAFINVIIRPGFVLNPVPRTILQGGSVTFTAIATGAPPIWYRWLTNSIGMVTNQTGILVLTNVLTNVNIRCAATNYSSGLFGVNMTPITGVALTVLADNDRDGMADVWEARFGFNTNNAGDALLDFDGDGMSNRDEYQAGTNPTNAQSSLKLTLTMGNPEFLEFVAQSNVAYALYYRTNLAFAPWLVLSNISPQSLVRTVRVNAPAPPLPPERYYRAITRPDP